MKRRGSTEAEGRVVKERMNTINCMNLSQTHTHTQTHKYTQVKFQEWNMLTLSEGRLKQMCRPVPEKTKTSLQNKLCLYLTYSLSPTLNPA